MKNTTSSLVPNGGYVRISGIPVAAPKIYLRSEGKVVKVTKSHVDGIEVILKGGEMLFLYREEFTLISPLELLAMEAE